MDRTRFEADERVDVPDANAISALADAGDRAMGHALGMPNEDETDYAFSVGCVLKPSGIVFAGVNITIGQDLGLLLGSESSALVGVLEGDGPPNGDVLTLAADTPFAGGAPTALIPNRWLMARPGLLSAGTSDTRVFYQLAAPKEYTKATDTRYNRAIQFQVVDDWATVKTEVANGWQPVCKMFENGGAPTVLEWYTLFPTISNVANYPSLYLKSMSQAFAAMAKELGLTRGGAYVWDSTIPATVTNVGLNIRALVLEGLNARQVKTAVTFRGDGVGGVVIEDSFNVPAGGVAVLGIGQFQVNKTAAGVGKFWSSQIAHDLTYVGTYSAEIDPHTAGTHIKTVTYAKPVGGGNLVALDVAAANDIYVSIVEYD